MIRCMFKSILSLSRLDMRTHRESMHTPFGRTELYLTTFEMTLLQIQFELNKLKSNRSFINFDIR